MTEIISCRDGYKCAEQPRRDRSGLDTMTVEGKRHEANADVQAFARYLMFVDEVTIMTMQGYETERRRRPGKFPPAVLDGRVGIWGEVTVGLSGLGEPAIRQRLGLGD